MKSLALSLFCLLCLTPSAQSQNSWLISAGREIHHHQIPQDLAQRIEQLRQRNRAFVQTAAFAPQAQAWLVSYYSGDPQGEVSHNASYWNFPKNCTRALDQAQSQGKLLRHAWSNNQAWVLIFDDNHFAQEGLPVPLLNQIGESLRQGAKLLDLSLSPAFDQGWVLITDQSLHYRNIPLEMLEMLEKLRQENKQIKQITFAPDGSAWIIRYDQDGYQGRNLNPLLEQQLQDLAKRKIPILHLALGY